MLLLTPSNKYCLCLRLKLWKWSNFHKYFAFSVRITVNPFVTNTTGSQSDIPTVFEGLNYLSGTRGVVVVVSQISRHASQLKPNKKKTMKVFCIGRPHYDEFLSNETMKQWNNESLKIAFLLLKVSFVLLLCVNEDGVGRTCGKVMPRAGGRWGKGKGQPVTGPEGPKAE